ncbi:hypothetical protein KEM48_009039 [Puccinia striiformis f. sp. tritici PST-130]|nr:hypothetical protein KEM48_009039 [Puccinia striiformis f. sp. tritici PST-130]
MSGSDPSPSSTTSEPAEDFELRFRQQGQLVIDGFKSLMSKHGNDSVGPDQACIFQEVTPALSTEKVESNEVLLNELLSQLLPLLAGQLNTLSLY